MSVKLSLRVLGTSAYVPKDNPQAYYGKVHTLAHADEARGDRGFSPVTYRASKAVVEGLNARGDFAGDTEIEIVGEMRQYGKNSEIHLVQLVQAKPVPVSKAA